MIKATRGGKNVPGNFYFWLKKYTSIAKFRFYSHFYITDTNQFPLRYASFNFVFFLGPHSLSYHYVHLHPVSLKGQRAAAELQAHPEQAGQGENAERVAAALPADQPAQRPAAGLLSVQTRQEQKIRKPLQLLVLRFLLVTNLQR